MRILRQPPQSELLDSNAAARLELPETVSVAMTEIAADMRERLLALAVGTGLQVMAQLMDVEVTAVCGPKGKHDPDGAAVRHGRENGSVTLGGRRVPVRRPRMRTADDAAEVPVPSYELFSQTEVLGRVAMQKMLAGISTRGFKAGLEPVGQRTQSVATSTSKSALSRRFAATETALTGLRRARDRYRRHQTPPRLGRKGPRRTPPRSPSCWSGCASEGWTRPVSATRQNEPVIAAWVTTGPPPKCHPSGAVK